jgi:hypothetical protein
MNDILCAIGLNVGNGLKGKFRWKTTTGFTQMIKDMSVIGPDVSIDALSLEIYALI